MRTTLSIATLAFVAVQAHGQLVLPYAGTDPTATVSSFQITKSGTAGRANTLYITNPANGSDALLVNTVGLGRAGYFTTTNAANVQMALRADSNGGGYSIFGLMTGTGKAGLFRILNAASSNNALQATTSGSGAAFKSVAGTGLAADFVGSVAVSGQVAAGSFVGNGSGLTAVNAATLGGVAKAGFGQLALDQAWTGQNSFSSALRPLIAQTTAATGDAIAGFFVTASDGGAAVFGRADATTGTTSGVQGDNSSPGGYGVFGSNLAASGTAFGGAFQTASSPTGIACYAIAGSATGVNYAFLGQQSGSSSAFAVYANGNMGASGTKPFRIDHPLDPENKYLFHYSTESPYPQNFYNGNTITDSDGYAWVQLPDYFEEVNKNFKYQLTVMGKSFAQAVVWEKIKGNRFQIRTNAPNVEVSWRVDADRNDLFVRRMQPKDVVDKEGPEKGKYLQPELFGFGKERGAFYNGTLGVDRPVPVVAERTKQASTRGR